MTVIISKIHGSFVELGVLTCIGNLSSYQKLNDFRSRFVKEFLVEINNHMSDYFPNSGNAKLDAFLNKHLKSDQMVSEKRVVIPDEELFNMFDWVMNDLFKPIAGYLADQQLPIDEDTLTYLSVLSGELYKKYKVHRMNDRQYWGDGENEFENDRPDLRFTTFSQLGFDIHQQPELFKKMLVSTLYLSDRLKKIDPNKIGDIQYRYLIQLTDEINESAGNLLSQNKKQRISMSYYLLMTCGIVNKASSHEVERLGQAVGGMSMAGRPEPVTTAGAGETFEMLFADIGEELGRDWKPFARRLGFGNSVDAIDMEKRTVKEKAIEVFSACPKTLNP